MFELVIFNIKTISNASTAVFNVTRYKGIKAYTVDKFELVLFSINIISKSSNIVFNVSKVHEIRCLKVLRHLNISTNG